MGERCDLLHLRSELQDIDEQGDLLKHDSRWDDAGLLEDAHDARRLPRRLRPLARRAAGRHKDLLVVGHLFTDA